MTEIELCPDCWRPPSERNAFRGLIAKPETGEVEVQTERCENPIHNAADHAQELAGVLGEIADAEWLEDHQDTGPPGEGWKSARLMDAIARMGSALRASNKVVGVDLGREGEDYSVETQIVGGKVEGMRKWRSRSDPTCLGCLGGSIHHTCEGGPRA